MAISYVKSVIQTCTACPAQWDVVLSDGRELYIIYRWGTFFVYGNKDDFDLLYSAEIGDELDGYMEEEKMLALLHAHVLDPERDKFEGGPSDQIG